MAHTPHNYRHLRHEEDAEEVEEEEEVGDSLSSHGRKREREGERENRIIIISLALVARFFFCEGSHTYYLLWWPRPCRRHG